MNLELIDSLNNLRLIGVENSCHIGYYQCPDIIDEDELSIYYASLESIRGKNEIEGSNNIGDIRTEIGSDRDAGRHNKKAFEFTMLTRAPNW